MHFHKAIHKGNQTLFNKKIVDFIFKMATDFLGHNGIVQNKGFRQNVTCPIWFSILVV